MKKILSIIISVTIVLSAATVVFAESDSGTKVLKVGTNAQFFPFEYYENGELKGFDIDLMNYIGERIGYDIEYVDMAFDALIPAVVNNEIDCVISGVSVTDTRERMVDYTTPYLSVGNGEDYAIVFPENYREKAELSKASGKEFIFSMVDDAVNELITDATIEKLSEKYEIGKQFVEDVEETAVTSPVPSDWAVESVDVANETGITYRSGLYLYQEDITREEFCELIFNFIMLINPEIDTFIPDSFTDTKNEKVLRLNSIGIINGKSSAEFAPYDGLTREEAAVIINRMIDKVMPMEATELWFEYDDINEISDWASGAVQKISNMGYMNGVEENRFAPKNSLTTEQAIAILVRIYKSAEVFGRVSHNAGSIGIIGGSDGPTAIFVTGNNDEKEYEKLYEEAKNNVIKIDKFYTDEAIKLISESGELAKDRDFISMYTTNDDMTNKIQSLGNVNFTNPAEVFLLSADYDKIVENIKAIAGDEAKNIDFAKMARLNKKYSFQTLASLINASYGAENLAALTILTNSRGYIMPKNFENDFALYLEYDGEYSAIVAFSRYGEGVISANMSFVKNGDKDNVFRRLYEITSAVGEEGIVIAKAEK